MNSHPHFTPTALFGLDNAAATGPATSDHFDIFEWYPRYQSCQRYFLDHAQHSVPVQALSSFLNILLPFQRHPHPISNSDINPTLYPGQHHDHPPVPPPAAGRSSSSTPNLPPPVSLIPYVRRLVATGMDFPGVLHGFFGDDWRTGIGPLHEQERRNYLFTAKSAGFAAAKKAYDMSPHETVPFLRPLQGPSDAEIEAAERTWSEWLAMEDWMLGSRAPDMFRDSGSQASAAASAFRPRSSRG